MKISAIVPCYNFEKNILQNISLLEIELQKEFKEYELIIINDGSNDATQEELEKIDNNKIIILKNDNNIGKSYSISRGLKIATGEKLFLYDCDLPYFEYLNIFLKKLKINKFVIIDRKNKKSLLRKDKTNLYQKIRHFVGNLITHIVCFFLHMEAIDTQSGMKGFDNIETFKNKKFVSKRFFLDIEIIDFFKRKGIYPIKIPVEFNIPNKSTIKLLDKKNISIFFELVKVIISLKKS